MTKKYVNDSAVEIVEEPPEGSVRHAVFDLDGTISLLRDGWQDHMVPMMIETLEACPGRANAARESREELTALIINGVDHLTGKQTIYQMIRLAEEVEKRGGTPEDPLVYKERYNERLLETFGERIRRLESGEASPEEFLITGSMKFLE